MKSAEDKLGELHAWIRQCGPSRVSSEGRDQMTVAIIREAQREAAAEMRERISKIVPHHLVLEILVQPLPGEQLICDCCKKPVEPGQRVMVDDDDHSRAWHLFEPDCPVSAGQVQP